MLKLLLFVVFFLFAFAHGMNDQKNDAQSLSHLPLEIQKFDQKIQLKRKELLSSIIKKARLTPRLWKKAYDKHKKIYEQKVAEHNAQLKPAPARIQKFVKTELSKTGFNKKIAILQDNDFVTTHSKAIIINPKMFTKNNFLTFKDLQNILRHEKKHITEKHSKEFHAIESIYAEKNLNEPKEVFELSRLYEVTCDCDKYELSQIKKNQITLKQCENLEIDTTSQSLQSDYHSLPNHRKKSVVKKARTIVNKTDNEASHPSWQARQQLQQQLQKTYEKETIPYNLRKRKADEIDLEPFINEHLYSSSTTLAKK